MKTIIGSITLIAATIGFLVNYNKTNIVDEFIIYDEGRDEGLEIGYNQGYEDGYHMALEQFECKK